MPKERRPSAVHEPDYQYLIGRMREAREAAGLTQAQVAKELDRPLSFVSKCELGERRLDPIDLRDFAEIYEKPLEFFYPTRRGSRKRSSG
ncbi:MAG: helix-turn-helix transcriptional regulator [Gemmatimonadota bacterium]